MKLLGKNLMIEQLKQIVYFPVSLGVKNNGHEFLFPGLSSFNRQ